MKKSWIKTNSSPFIHIGQNQKGHNFFGEEMGENPTPCCKEKEEAYEAILSVNTLLDILESGGKFSLHADSCPETGNLRGKVEFEIPKDLLYTVEEEEGESKNDELCDTLIDEIMKAYKKAKSDANS